MVKSQISGNIWSIDELNLKEFWKQRLTIAKHNYIAWEGNM